MTLTRQHRQDRRHDIYEIRLRNVPFHEIAAKHGLTIKRARQLWGIEHAKRT